jgi:hypothetical protein
MVTGAGGGTFTALVTGTVVATVVGTVVAAVVGTVVATVVGAVLVDDEGAAALRWRARAGPPPPPHELSSSTVTATRPTRAGRGRPRLWCAPVPRPERHVAALVCTGLLSCGLLAACSSTPRIAARHIHSLVKETPVTSEPTTTAPGTTSAPTTTAPPRFVGSVAPVDAAQVAATWRPGCPVGPAQLRMLTMSYWGFDGQSHTGTMIVNSAVTSAVLQVFGQLFAEHFPIHEMQPEDAYGGQDPRSMAADNTSGFNCRVAVAPGPPSWSVHAFGEAIDVNPVENPYLEGGQVQPAAGAAFTDRADVRPGMAVPGGPLVHAFASVGWQWGGRWTASPDYQHFSATGG